MPSAAPTGGSRQHIQQAGPAGPPGRNGRVMRSPTPRPKGHHVKLGPIRAQRFQPVAGGGRRHQLSPSLIDVF
jgi:hypothetical protein